VAVGNKRAMYYCQLCEQALCRGYTIHRREIGFAIATGDTRQL